MGKNSDSVKPPDVNLPAKVSGWLSMSRPAFHIVGLLPFFLGTLLAWKLEGVFHPTVFLLGSLAVILIMLSTYQSGEYFDYEEDALSRKHHPSRFAGGSGILQKRILSPLVALITSVVSMLLAVLIGVVLQFVLNTGPWTLLLGCAGALPGFFYSRRPVRLVNRGIGELFIGFCYGWLPIASAFYIQSGYIPAIIAWMSLPVGLTIFNVILLNEFPDYPADLAVGKRNLLVRFGKKRGAELYSLAAFFAWISHLLSPWFGIPSLVIPYYLPVMILSVILVAMVLQKKYENRITLEILCGLNIVVNIGTTLSYLLAYL